MSDRSTGGEKAPEGGAAPATNTGVKRPLVPVVLALILGLAAGAWGLQIPRGWLVLLLAVLLGAMFLLFFSARHKMKRGQTNPPEIPSRRSDSVKKSSHPS
jgi:uncharacterized membrane protein YfcA